MVFFTSAVALATLLVSSLPCVAAADCSHDTLQAGADTYIAAQQSGKLDDLNKLISTSNFSYLENNKKADIKSGILTKALKLDHNRTAFDPVQCATYTELVSVGGPYVTGAQIRHSADGTVNTIDIIRATKGDWAFDAAKTLQYISKEDWGTQPTDKRSTREVLQAAGDAYLDMWSDSTAKNRVPWGTPCDRTEGGMHASPCTSGAPSGGGSKKTDQRRYVIDEAAGTADIMCAFTGSMADSHEFRLEGGKLRFVHTITV